MTFDALNDSTTAIIAALFGGAGVKLLDRMLTSRSTYLAETERFRTELREQVAQISKDLAETREESDEWRQKYWDLVEATTELKTSHVVHLQEIDSMKSEINGLVFRLEGLRITGTDIDPE